MGRTALKFFPFRVLHTFRDQMLKALQCFGQDQFLLDQSQFLSFYADHSHWL